MAEADLGAASFEALHDALTYQVLPDSHILVYPIPGLDGAVDEGRRLMNIVWYRNVPEDELPVLLTDRTGRPAPCRCRPLPPGAARDEVIAEMRDFAGRQVANVVFEDADLDAAVPVITTAILQNAGQTCSAGSRLLVHRAVHAELVDRLAEAFAAVRVGPGAEVPDLGPLISGGQRDRVPHSSAPRSRAATGSCGTAAGSRPVWSTTASPSSPP